MKRRTLSQTEWTFVLIVPTIQETQSLLPSMYNSQASTTALVETNFTVRFVAASVPTKRHLYLQIVE
mgnify:CR=1 FL=1|jgi:hypothetical protein|tara:strand:- start:442 stop:642 length:201 start_codon:yes stop_codon:yes gene_type:complete